MAPWAPGIWPPNPNSKLCGTVGVIAIVAIHATGLLSIPGTPSPPGVWSPSDLWALWLLLGVAPKADYGYACSDPISLFPGSPFVEVGLHSFNCGSQAHSGRCACWREGQGSSMVLLNVSTVDYISSGPSAPEILHPVMAQGSWTVRLQERVGHMCVTLEIELGGRRPIWKVPWPWHHHPV